MVYCKKTTYSHESPAQAKAGEALGGRHHSRGCLKEKEERYQKKIPDSPRQTSAKEIRSTRAYIPLSRTLGAGGTSQLETALLHLTPYIFYARINTKRTTEELRSIERKVVGGCRQCAY